MAGVYLSAGFSGHGGCPEALKACANTDPI